MATITDSTPTRMETTPDLSPRNRELELQELESLLSPVETITKEDPRYETESKTWSTSKNSYPSLVLRPNSTGSLARILKFLQESSLDFNIRNSGAGNASAKDVIISTRAFTDFEFDREAQVVTIGAGSIWQEYYEKMRDTAPEYSVVAAATPFIGVGGSTIAGGFSLMSKEYGCISDPENMLDAEVVKLDGSIVWASTEPDLLWGLRGGYLGLGVVTKLKLRARKYPQDIWGGSIIIPRAQAERVAKAVATTDASDKVEQRVFALILLMPEVFVINAFDALGETHGRETFEPFLSIEGAVDTTRIMDLAGFAAMQAPAEYMKGTSQVWWNPLALGQLNESFVLKTFEWQAHHAKSGTNAAVMYELWGTRGPSEGPSAAAWPRPANVRHFCMLSMAVPSDASCAEAERAKKLIQAAPHELLGGAYDDSLVATSALDEYHDVRRIYASNWDRILRVKQTYDPKCRLIGSALAHACAQDLKLKGVS